MYSQNNILNIVQSAGAVEYNDYFFAEEQTPPPYECPRCNIKQSNGEVPVMLKLWGMQNTPLWPSLLGPLRPGIVATDRVLSMGQIEPNCVLMLN